MKATGRKCVPALPLRYACDDEPRGSNRTRQIWHTPRIPLSPGSKAVILPPACTDTFTERAMKIVINASNSSGCGSSTLAGKRASTSKDHKPSESNYTYLSPLRMITTSSSSSKMNEKLYAPLGSVPAANVTIPLSSWDRQTKF